MNEDETNKEVADVLHSIADILSGKVKRDKSFAVSKLDLFGGTADLEAWARIEEYLSSGKASDLSAKERVWLDLLMLIHSLDWKYGKRVTMRFLTSKPVSLTGGAWGIALLAAYLADGKSAGKLEDYLNSRVFKNLAGEAVNPDPEEVKGFEEFTRRYVAGLEVEKAAINAMKW